MSSTQRRPERGAGGAAATTPAAGEERRGAGGETLHDSARRLVGQLTARQDGTASRASLAHLVHLRPAGPRVAVLNHVDADQRRAVRAWRTHLAGLHRATATLLARLARNAHQLTAPGIGVVHDFFEPAQ